MKQENEHRQPVSSDDAKREGKSEEEYKDIDAAFTDIIATLRRDKPLRDRVRDVEEAYVVDEEASATERGIASLVLGTLRIYREEEEAKKGRPKDTEMILAGREQLREWMLAHRDAVGFHELSKRLGEAAIVVAPDAERWTEAHIRGIAGEIAACDALARHTGQRVDFAPREYDRHDIDLLVKRADGKIFDVQVKTRGYEMTPEGLGGGSRTVFIEKEKRSIDRVTLEIDGRFLDERYGVADTALDKRGLTEIERLAGGHGALRRSA